jgi:hypothetical protein
VVATSVWNSLEVVKLVVAALTPVLVAAVGYWINRRLKSLEAAQWAQQKIIERRIIAYDELAPSLNTLFCFFAYVGGWKEMKPPDVVALKRALDQTAHISAPLFEPSFLQLYNAFIDECFTTFGGWGENARLRTHIDRRKGAAGPRWDPSWEACFADPSNARAPSDVKAAYTNLLAYLAQAMGATQVDAHILGPGRLPSDFDTSAVSVVSRTPDDSEVAA